ncbi:hypothetical protein [Rhizobium ecuadorense]|uniref:hypothetical protein n=1 Tax=Rhizobium ecuadorense TaxID=1671795 RepID=UPI000673C560|nr:hypothetical protein [Rhizobium ecuadorense]
MEDSEPQSQLPEDHTGHSSRSGTIDPSESVTGVAIVFGIIGAVVGIVATILTADASGGLEWIACCIIGVLAGGSAGIVIGGLFGAIFGVLRGVTVPTLRHPER